MVVWAPESGRDSNQFKSNMSPYGWMSKRKSCNFLLSSPNNHVIKVGSISIGSSPVWCLSPITFVFGSWIQISQVQFMKHQAKPHLRSKGNSRLILQNKTKATSSGDLMPHHTSHDTSSMNVTQEKEEEILNWLQPPPQLFPLFMGCPIIFYLA